MLKEDNIFGLVVPEAVGPCCLSVLFLLERVRQLIFFLFKHDLQSLLSKSHWVGRYHVLDGFLSCFMDEVLSINRMHDLPGLFQEFSWFSKDAILIRVPNSRFLLGGLLFKRLGIRPLLDWRRQELIGGKIYGLV